MALGAQDLNNNIRRLSVRQKLVKYGNRATAVWRVEFIPWHTIAINNRL
jgi:hypothetical protein